MKPKAPLLLAVLFLVSVTGCPTTPPDYGNIRSMSVTGTDGKVADPAEATPTENMGMFGFGFDIEPSPNTYVIASLKAPASGDTVQLATYCCNASGSDCTPHNISCQYLASNSVNCGSGAVLLTDFFTRNGGLPNQAHLVIETDTHSCNGDFSFTSRQHFNSRDIVFH